MFAVRLITARRRGVNTGEQACNGVAGRSAALPLLRRSRSPEAPSAAVRR